MSVFTYAEDGERVPFDPATVDLAGCILCGRPRIAIVGVFIPHTDEMRSVVLKLRRHAVRTHSTPCVAYGLCKRHARQDVADRVEAALEAAAGKVAVQ